MITCLAFFYPLNPSVKRYYLFSNYINLTIDKEYKQVH